MLAFGQTGAGGDNGETGSLHLGPINLTPTVAISNVGYNTNVFQTPENPQSDFSGAVRPGVLYSLRMRRAQVSGQTSVGYTYFRETKNQRALDVAQNGRVAVLLNRLTPRATIGYASMRQRPNLEIDALVRTTTRTVGIGADVRLWPRLTATVDAQQSRSAFEDADFLGVNLRSALTRRSDALSASLRTELTPLTTFVVRGQLLRDRFTFDPLRNSDSVSIVPGFELKPAALISGSAFVGYRHFQPRSPTLPDFVGVIASVGVSYTLLGRTRFSLSGQRDVEYSFEATQPYYVTTGASLGVTQVIGRGWDVVGTVGRFNLPYRAALSSSSGERVRRIDRAESYGFGVGRRLGRSARLGFDANHSGRHSDLKERSYGSWRFGGSFTYGL